MSWTNGQSVRTNQPPFVDSGNEERTFNTQNANYTQQGGYKRAHRAYSSQNNTKDVAATFTQEGLQTFAAIFSSSVEAVLVKALPDLVEKAVEKVVERKMEEMSKHVLLEIQRVMESRPPAKPQASDSLVGEALALRAVQGSQSGDALVEIVDNPEPVDVSHGSRLVEDSQLVMDVMQRLGRPVRTSELPDLIPDVYWGHNISMKMNKLMNRSGGHIERISKGLYVYKD